MSLEKQTKIMQSRILKLLIQYHWNCYKKILEFFTFLFNDYCCILNWTGKHKLFGETAEKMKNMFQPKTVISLD